MKIVIPFIPNSLNKYAGRKNCWEYREEKAKWLQIGMMLVKRPSKPFDKAIVEIEYFFPTRARHDPDNYSGKVILDLLVNRGILWDDSFKCVNLVLKGNHNKERPRTEITITEVKNG